ncbi:MAG TPA: ATP-binding cassette domain-containing protein, partial [Microthrixaceae bacterium]|nr:ATP-binding cassette domain-containing protein [Microthrixaceae bacterium]
MTTVRIRALTRTFAGHPPVRALSGVDLDIADGTLAAVLGPSGCGKTTLLRTIAGMERADGGTIAVGDRVLADAGSHVAPERRRIGLVPQEGALFPHLDVAGNVAFGLRRLASDERRRRVDELLELVDLAGHGGRRPH